MSLASRLSNRLRHALAKARRPLQPRGQVYMFLPINGAGLGHLTRCLAIARQVQLLQPQARIIFVTTSIAVPLVQQFGFICHHITPHSLSALDTRDWNGLLATTVAQLLRLYRPAVFVFDGSAPYAGLRRVMRWHRGVRYVWVRRGGYRTGVDVASLGRDQGLFQHVLIPQEPFAVLPEGGSAPCKTGHATRISPVLMLEGSELLAPLEAARALGVEAEFAAGKQFVYVQLGAGNINATSALLDTVVAVLKARGFCVIVGVSPIALGIRPPAGVVRSISDYPNSRYFALFSFAVLAGGYNSVCEAVGLGLPAIFVPNLHTVADDQLARVQAAQSVGIFEVLASPAAAFEEALERLLQRCEHGQPASRPPFNGAQQAAVRLIALANPARPTE